MHVSASHTFDPAELGGLPRGHEQRTWAVAGVNLLAMAVLLTGGLALRSAAVLAEGVHTGAHVGAVIIAGAAYRIAARRQGCHSVSPRRVIDAAGLVNAAFLLVVAVVLAMESLGDLRRPAALNIVQTVGLASFGLVVNVASLALLNHAHEGAASGHDRSLRRDLSFHAINLHMIGDAAVGLMSIAALLLMGVFGWRWADSVAGLAGAALITVLAFQIVQAVFAGPAPCDP